MGRGWEKTIWLVNLISLPMASKQPCLLINMEMLGVTTTFGSLPTDKLLSVFVDRKIRFSLNIFFQVMVVKKGGKNKNYD